MENFENKPDFSGTAREPLENPSAQTPPEQNLSGQTAPDDAPIAQEQAQNGQAFNPDDASGAYSQPQAAWQQGTQPPQGAQNAQNTGGQWQQRPPVYPFIPYGLTPETYAVKKDIRRRAVSIGVPVLVMLVFTFLWAQIFYLIMGKFGIAPTEAYKMISEPAVLQGVQIFISMLIFTVPFALSARISGHRISDLIPFEKPEKGLALPFFCFGLGFCAFANISVSYAGSIFESFGIHYSVDSGDVPRGVFGFFLTLLSTAVVPALVEEFACRGVILGFLRKYGDGFAVLTSAILFGAMHGNFDQIPFAFLVGAVLGYIRVKTGSLWVCCLVHSANNLVSVLFEYVFNGVPVMAQNTIYAVFLMCCLLLAVAGVFLLRKRGNGIYSFEKKETAVTEKQKYKWFFTSPLIIIFLSLCFLESLFYFK